MFLFLFIVYHFLRNLNLTREMQTEWINIKYHKYDIIMAISDNLIMKKIWYIFHLGEGNFLTLNKIISICDRVWAYTRGHE